MKFFFIALILFSTSLTLAQEPSKKVLLDINIYNAKVAAEQFASKVVKGKLDSKGYASLREKVGILVKGQKLKALEPHLVKNSWINHSATLYENSWIVSLSKVSKGILNNAPPVFKTLVHCIAIAGLEHPVRFTPYFVRNWDINCKMAKVFQD